MAIKYDNVTLLVLCGGLGSRMRGQDKPLLPYEGQPMIDRVIASTSEIDVLISANRNLDEYSLRGPVFTDREVATEIASPLNGVLGGLERCSTDWLLVVPGDSPTLPINWWHRLCDAMNPNRPGLVVHDGERQQNLHLLIHRRLAADLRAYLKEGLGEVWRFLERAGVAAYSLPEPDWFKNVNEAEDLA